MLIIACASDKRVPDKKKLLTKNEIIVNDKLVKEERINNLVVQQPNTKFLNYPFGLALYNAAKPNPDSSYQAWLERKPNRRENLNRFLSAKQINRLGESFFVSGLPNFMKETGEAPVIIDEKKAIRSKERLSGFYYNNGFIRNTVTMSIDSIGKKISVVKDVVKKLKLSNVEAQQVRAESLVRKYDFVVSRAVTRMIQFYPWVKGKIKKEDC